RDDRCTGAHAEMEAIWNEGRAEDIAGHFAAVDPRVGPDTWALQRVRVQTYADQWVAAHTETCAATSLRGEQSSAAMQLRMTCLRHAKIGLDAALTVLADPGPQTVPRAHTVVGGLPDLGRCDDAQRLAEAEPPPPELAAQVDAVHRDIARSRSLILAGKYDEAVEVAASTVDEASEAAHRPTVARALLAHAGAQMRTSKLEEAADAARKAQRLALSLGLWPVALESVRLWMYVVGYRQAKTAQALPMVDFALGLAEHVGSIDRSARLHGTIGALHLQDGNFELAAAQYEAELNLLRSAKTPDRYTIGNALSNVAQAEMRMGDLDAALARQREVLALRRDSVGAEHPVVANALNAIAGTLAELGRFPESEARYREALALRTKVLRPRHPDTAAAQQNLATVLLEQGRLEEGEALLREAITASDAELGPGHPRAITARNNLAQTLLRMGRLEEAETMARAVVDGRTRALPAGHVQIGTAHGNLATILRHAGKAAEAEPHHRAALEILDAALEPGHHVVVNNRGNLASTLLELDRADEAVQELRRATRDGAAKHGEAHPQVANARKHLGLALLQLDRRAEAYDELAGAWEALRDSPPEVRADAAFAFAQAAIDRPDERAAALKLGRMARKLYAEAMETPDPDAVAEVDAWLSEHAPANPP
ncbi:MAG: tetratricopeptide repeat protein, partial [Myxococcota bacterium]